MTASGQHVARQSASRAPIAVASLLAWVGLSIGIGVGVPWLLDDGTSPVSLAGAGALLLGLVALVVGAARLLRALRGWWRLLLLPWLLGIVVGTYCLSIALAATVVSPTPVPDPPTAVAAGTEVAMTTADGGRRSGWYVPGTNGAAVVLRHGAGSQRFDTAGQAAVLARNGYGVLLVDARGHGRSGGAAMDFGWYGDADTAAAVDFLASQPGIDADRIAVLGLSMGGEEAIGAAAGDPRVRAVVAEGATGRTAADKAWLSQEYGVAGVLQEQLDQLTYALVDLFSSAPPPASLEQSVRAAAGTKFLLVAAGGVPDEGLVAQRLAAASPRNVSVWVVEGAGHTAGLATDPAAWEQRVVGFLDTALAEQPTV